MNIFHLDCDSIFKTRWTKAPCNWHDKDLAESVSYALEIKKCLNKEMPSNDPIEFSIFLAAQPELFHKLKVSNSVAFLCC